MSTIKICKFTNVEQYKRISIDYFYGCLQIYIDEIFELIPELKTYLKLVDYNDFKNLNKISTEEKIIFAYEKDNNIYILTENINGVWTYLYKYENDNIIPIDMEYFSFYKCNMR